MSKFKRKISQGEIFGMALVFVIILFSLLIYSKVHKASPDNSVFDVKYQELQLLVENSLIATLNMGTDCHVERFSNTVGDLVKYCMMKTYSSANDEAFITCDDGKERDVCAYSLQLINLTLYKFFNSSNYFDVPFYIYFKTPQSSGSYYDGKNFSNFRWFDNGKLNLDNLMNKGYLNKVSTRDVYPTAQGPLVIYLNIYLKHMNN